MASRDCHLLFQSFALLLFIGRLFTPTSAQDVVFETITITTLEVVTERTVNSVLTVLPSCPCPSIDTDSNTPSSSTTAPAADTSSLPSSTSITSISNPTAAPLEPFQILLIFSPEDGSTVEMYLTRNGQITITGPVGFPFYLVNQDELVGAIDLRRNLYFMPPNFSSAHGVLRERFTDILELFFGEPPIRAAFQGFVQRYSGDTSKRQGEFSFLLTEPSDKKTFNLGFAICNYSGDYGDQIFMHDLDDKLPPNCIAATAILVPVSQASSLPPIQKPTSFQSSILTTSTSQVISSSESSGSSSSSSSSEIPFSIVTKSFTAYTTALRSGSSETTRSTDSQTLSVFTYFPYPSSIKLLAGDDDPRNTSLLDTYFNSKTSQWGFTTSDRRRLAQVFMLRDDQTIWSPILGEIVVDGLGTGEAIGVNAMDNRFLYSITAQGSNSSSLVIGDQFNMTNSQGAPVQWNLAADGSLALVGNTNRSLWICDTSGSWHIVDANTTGCNYLPATNLRMIGEQETTTATYYYLDFTSSAEPRTTTISVGEALTATVVTKLLKSLVTVTVSAATPYRLTTATGVLEPTATVIFGQDTTTIITSIFSWEPGAANVTSTSDVDGDTKTLVISVAWPAPVWVRDGRQLYIWVDPDDNSLRTYGFGASGPIADQNKSDFYPLNDYKLLLARYLQGQPRLATPRIVAYETDVITWTSTLALIALETPAPVNNFGVYMYWTSTISSPVSSATAELATSVWWQFNEYALRGVPTALAVCSENDGVPATAYQNTGRPLVMIIMSSSANRWVKYGSQTCSTVGARVTVGPQSLQKIDIFTLVTSTPSTPTP